MAEELFYSSPVTREEFNTLKKEVVHLQEFNTLKKEVAHLQQYLLKVSNSGGPPMVVDLVGGSSISDDGYAHYQPKAGSSAMVQSKGSVRNLDYSSTRSSWQKNKLAIDTASSTTRKPQDHSKALVMPVVLDETSITIMFIFKEQRVPVTKTSIQDVAAMVGIAVCMK